MILVGLLALERRGRPFPGRTFWGYLLAYGITRFVIEGFRGDDRGVVFGLWSTSQFISLLLVPVSLVMLLAPCLATTRRPAGDPGRRRRAA